MSTGAPFAVVLRLAGFKFLQSDLEVRLQAVFERFSLDGGGYAQLTIEKDELNWEAIDAFLQRYGPVIRELREIDVQSACLDLAYDLREGLALASYTIPARTAALAGANNIDVMFSVYLSAP